jgi:CRISPR-associated protein Cas2
VVVSVQVILVYDTAVRHNPKALRTCRRYLHWVQRSVFEGQLTPAQLRQLHADLKAVLDGLDSVIVYRVDGPATLTREVWGHEYGNIDSIL